MEDFKGNETILYDTKMMDPCHYICVNHRMYNMESEPQYKLSTCGKLLCSFPSCNKCALLGGNVDNEGGLCMY